MFFLSSLNLFCLCWPRLQLLKELLPGVDWQIWTATNGLKGFVSSLSVQILILNIVQSFLSVLVLSTSVVHRGVSTPVFTSHILSLPWLNISKNPKQITAYAQLWNPLSLSRKYVLNTMWLVAGLCPRARWFTSPGWCGLPGAALVYGHGECSALETPVLMKSVFLVPFFSWLCHCFLWKSCRSVFSSSGHIQNSGASLSWIPNTFQLFHNTTHALIILSIWLHTYQQLQKSFFDSVAFSSHVP